MRAESAQLRTHEDMILIVYASFASALQASKYRCLTSLYCSCYPIDIGSLILKYNP